MNILKYPIASEERLEEAGNSILGGSPVFEITNKDLYIKNPGTGELIPIAGNCKQNKLVAGDNIEILTEKEEDKTIDERHPEIRLADDIIVKTVTVNPDEDNLPNWRATIKLGELTNGNAVFLITKETAVTDSVQGIIGGELIIKMETESKGTYYAEYEFTISSTGSWSLWGGSEAATNARVCKVKYKDEWYYGIKIPTGDFSSIKKTDAPDTETRTETKRLYLQMPAYSGTTSFQLADEEGNTINLTPLGSEDEDADGFVMTTFECNMDSLMKLCGWDSLLQNTNVVSSNWEDKGYYSPDTEQGDNLLLYIHHRQVTDSSWTILGQSDTLYLYKTNVARTTATYGLYRGNTENIVWFGTAQNTHDTNSDTPGYINGEQLSTAYNSWYEMTVADFQTACGITFKGEWAKYAADTKYHIGFRIYTKSNRNTNATTSWTRINCIQITDTSVTNVITKRRGGYYGEVLVDFTADITDVPFTWTSVLMNIKGDGYEQEERYVNMVSGSSCELGTFIDRETNDSPSVAENVVVSKIFISNHDESASDYYSNLFDSNYLTNNYTEVSSFPNNRIPLFRSDGNTEDPIATLYYSEQGGVTTDSTNSFLMDLICTYEIITGHHYTYETYTDNLNITKAEFWYNGWDVRDESLIPEQPNDDSVLEYQVLSRESNDDDSFSEIFYFDNSTISVIVAKIKSLQELGEDAPPYKMIIRNMELSLTDLQYIADVVQLARRQIYLDLSGCTVDSTATTWNTSIFEGCSSLRGMVIPQKVQNISAAAWLWCTYMRDLDLTPSESTLTTLGASTGYNTSLGLLTSTRVRNFILPRNVNQLNAYVVYSSNVRNMIYLHHSGDNPIKVVQWTFMGINNKGNTTSELGEDFHMFFETDYLDELIKAYTGGGSLSNYAYQMGSAGNPTGNTGGWWTQEAVNSFVRFDKDWTQEEWQSFNNTYGWGEELINDIRRQFGATVDYEIIDYA